MPRDGSGTMVLVYDWEADRDAGIKIRADRHKAQDDDFALGITNSIPRNGEAAATANLPMGTFKHTGVGAASNATDYLRADQQQKNTLTYYVATGTDTYAITPAPAISAYAAGVAFDVKIANANTSRTVTLNASGVGPITVNMGGVVKPQIGELEAGTIFRFQHDGTVWQATGSGGARSGLVDGGEKDAGFTVVAGTKYRCDLHNNAAFTVTGPASATVGDVIELTKFGVNAVTFAPNGLKFNGSTASVVTTAEGVSTLIYTGTDRGWVEG